MKHLAIAVLALGLSAATRGVEIAGVNVPDTETVEGKTLKLNGAGLRKKYVVAKVYVLGLYLETPSRDAAAILSSDQVRDLRMSVLRDVSGAKISEAITGGFERHSGGRLASLKARLARLAALIPDLAKGDEVLLTYLPGKGTVVRAKGAERGVIEGKDFSDALLAVWLGPDPVQEDLKRALLGS
jgi:Chalcone isomerase-like